MKTGPSPCSPTAAFLGLATAAAQIQSITDESRSSIRRKNPGAAQSTTFSRESSPMEDTQEDEVADCVNPLLLLVDTLALVFTKHLRLQIQFDLMVENLGSDYLVLLRNGLVSVES